MDSNNLRIDGLDLTDICGDEDNFDAVSDKLSTDPHSSEGGNASPLFPGSASESSIMVITANPGSTSQRVVPSAAQRALRGETTGRGSFDGDNKRLGSWSSSVNSGLDSVGGRAGEQIARPQRS